MTKPTVVGFRHETHRTRSLDSRWSVGQHVSEHGDGMTRNEDFFRSPQGAATMKHAILKGYLPVFAGATGSTSIDNRVAYVDAFAGPGS